MVAGEERVEEMVVTLRRSSCLKRRRYQCAWNQCGFSFVPEPSKDYLWVCKGLLNDQREVSPLPPQMCCRSCSPKVWEECGRTQLHTGSSGWWSARRCYSAIPPIEGSETKGEVASLWSCEDNPQGTCLRSQFSHRSEDDEHCSWIILCLVNGRVQARIGSWKQDRNPKLALLGHHASAWFHSQIFPLLEIRWSWRSSQWSVLALIINQLPRE